METEQERIERQEKTRKIGYDLEDIIDYDYLHNLRDAFIEYEDQGCKVSINVQQNVGKSLVSNSYMIAMLDDIDGVRDFVNRDHIKDLDPEKFLYTVSISSWPENKIDFNSNRIVDEIMKYDENIYIIKTRRSTPEKVDPYYGTKHFFEVQFELR